MVSEQDREKLVAFVHGELNQLEGQRLAARFQTEEDLRLEYEALLATNDALEDLFLTPAKEDLSRARVERILRQARGVDKSASQRRIFYAASGAVLAASLALVLWTKPTFKNEKLVAPSAPTAALEAVESTRSQVVENRNQPQPEGMSVAAEAPAAPSVVAESSELAQAPAADQAPMAESEVAPSQSLAMNEKLAKRMDSSGDMRAKAAAPAKKASSKADTMIAANQVSDMAKERVEAKGGAVTDGYGAASAPAASRSMRGGEPAEWFACSAVADCVVIEDFCVWRAINKKFAKAFQDLPRVNPYECQAPRPDPAMKAKLNLQCKNAKCVIGR